MKYTTVSETEPLDTEYLLANESFPRIPRGDVTGFYGDGSVGKGRMLMSIAAEVTRNGWSSIVILPEDHPNEQVRPRLEAAGADTDLVVNLTKLPGGGRFRLSASPKQDGNLSELREAIYTLAEEGHDVRFVNIDPVSAVVAFGSISTNAGARRVVEGLQDIAEDTGVAIALVAHTVKNGKLQGSAGLEQALRTLYKVSKDGTNPLVRNVSLVKGNNLPDLPDLRYVIEEDDNGPRVVWLTDREVEKRTSSWRAPVDTGQQTKLILALDTAIAPLSVKRLSEMIGATPQVTRTQLWRMKQRGQVAQTVDGWIVVRGA